MAQNGTAETSGTNAVGRLERSLKLTSYIGEGTFGIVFKAMISADLKPVAVQITDRQNTAQLLEKLQIISNKASRDKHVLLHHDCWMDVLSKEQVDEINGLLGEPRLSVPSGASGLPVLCSLTELYGDNLRKRLVRNALNFKQSCVIFMEIVRALEHIHRLGLSHGNLTSENVHFVDEVLKIGVGSGPEGDNGKLADLSALSLILLELVRPEQTMERLETPDVPVSVSDRWPRIADLVGALTSVDRQPTFDCIISEVLKVVLAHDVETTADRTSFHKGVRCSNCGERDFAGFRYRCSVCPDYDLCKKCRHDGNFRHDDRHPFIELLRPVIHRHVRCDSCDKDDFEGKRHKCLTCPDYDLCDSCILLPSSQHPDDHEFLSLEGSMSPCYIDAALHKLITCDACKVSHFSSIRYKCRACLNYNLCEKCRFVPDAHSPGHQFHEIRVRPSAPEVHEQVLRSLHRKEFTGEM